MIIEQTREYLFGRPDDENVARSIFRFPGRVSAKQLRDAIEGRPSEDYVNLHHTGDGNIEIDVRRKDEFGKFFTI